MKLKVKILKLLTGKPVVILHEKTADRLGVHIDDRLSISKKNKSIISVLDISTGLFSKDEGEIAVSDEVAKALKLREKEYVEVNLAAKPESAFFIYKKLHCKTLSKKEITKIVNDIVKNALTETEIAYFVSSIHKCGMSLREIEYFIRAIVETGKKLNLKGKIIDKHGIGGVAGNRTTPIIISICAEAGLIMPKTSSRAITSAAGTADVVETIANVEFPIQKLYKIIKKTNACMVWGGYLGLAPADDKLIQVEKILNLDPEPQLLASILAKKIAAGSKYVLIDIPYGNSAKVSKSQAEKLKIKFRKLAKKFNIELKCVLTDGSQPVGNGIGPILEIKDIISILKQEPNKPKDLEERALFLTAELLELSGKAKKGKGEKLAKEILESGRAFKKFKQIIKAQQGDADKKLKLGKFKKHIISKSNHKIKEINNKKINFLANIAGSPADKGAGIYLFKHKNQTLKKGEKILTIYAETKAKLSHAVKFYKKAKPIGFY